MTGYERYAAIRVEGPDAQGVVTVSFFGPGLHAVTAEAHRELVDVWVDIARDDRARAVIVRGEGEKAFSSGGSFDLVDAMIASVEVRTRVLRETRELVRNIIDCPVPIVAAINGPAAGAGLVTAACADITIAGRGATIVDGHPRLGVASGDHAALVWPLLMSMAHAKYHLLLNEPIRGKEAERIGMVSKCVDDDLVQSTAREIAERLARGSQRGIRATKHALNNWYRQNWSIFEASLGLEFYNFGEADVIEGVASFREKRDPRFS
ncbi:MAG: enoyl-CoA hydratase/isomerase family protein [Tetrasphaera sp.]